MKNILDLDSSTCEVCGSDKLSNMLDLGNQPLCDDLVEISSKRICEKYPIKISICNQCLTAHQKYQIDPKLLFPSNYHYRASLTQDVLLGMGELCADVERLTGDLKGKTILDVGCNDGSLLSFFMARGARAVGVEPTGAAAQAKEKGITTYNSYFTPSLACQIVEECGEVDYITFTNVFAHISDLSNLLSAVKKCITDKTILVIENHYLGAVLDRLQFDTFYHEHPRTYSATSFKYIAKRLGLSVDHISFPKRYSGNIRVIMSQRSNCENMLPDESGFLKQAGEFQARIEVGRDAKLSELNALVEKHGPLKGKAFPGRAAVVCSFLGIDETMIAATYERPLSPKIGHYIPGTHIPILSDTLLAEENNGAPVVNFAWHIRDEIHHYLAERDLHSVIDIWDGC